MMVAMEHLVRGARAWGVEINPEALDKFQLYYEELISWNRRLNLTSITDYEEVQIKHFLDSLSLHLVLEPSLLEGGEPFIDVGAGAGFPGLPLKIVHPQISLALLEATVKKARFLTHLVERLALTRVEVVMGRAEEMARREEHRERYQVALARAVAPLPVLLEYALPLCQVGGLLIAQKGPDIREELEDSQSALTILGGRIGEVRELELPLSMGRRNLVVVVTVAPTPEKYPRRPGIPAKRPLN